MSTDAQQSKKFASEAAFVDALREVLGLDPIIGKARSGVTYHDAWPAPSDGCRRAPTHAMADNFRRGRRR